MYRIITDVEEAKVLWPLNVLYCRWKDSTTYAFRAWSLWSCEKLRFTPEQLWKQDHFKDLDIAVLVEDEDGSPSTEDDSDAHSQENHKVEGS